MSTIPDTYKHLAHPWSQDELADRFEDVRRQADQMSDPDDDRAGPTAVAMLASAVPAIAALSIAIHVVHALPDAADRGLLDHLLLTAERNAAVGLQRMNRALALDGVSHGYTAEEWLPAIYEVAGCLLESASVNRDPPSLVEEANAAVRWLSQAIVEADQNAPDTAAAIVDGLGRILTLALFATVARRALLDGNP